MQTINQNAMKRRSFLAPLTALAVSLTFASCDRAPEQPSAQQNSTAKPEAPAAPGSPARTQATADSPRLGAPGTAAVTIAAPADIAATLDAPILSIFGGDDHGINEEVRAAWEKALAAAGREHATIVYDGAPHSFFDRKQEQFADASADAWRRTLSFLEEVGAPAHA